jgi:hypothetical protein
MEHVLPTPLGGCKLATHGIYSVETIGSDKLVNSYHFLKLQLKVIKDFYRRK